LHISIKFSHVFLLCMTCPQVEVNSQEGFINILLQNEGNLDAQVE